MLIFFGPSLYDLLHNLLFLVQSVELKHLDIRLVQIQVQRPLKVQVQRHVQRQRQRKIRSLCPAPDAVTLTACCCQSQLSPPTVPPQSGKPPMSGVDVSLHENQLFTLSTQQSYQCYLKLCSALNITFLIHTFWTTPTLTTILEHKAE